MADPGVIVQQRMEQRAQEPVFGETPAAIIGPIVNVQKEAEYDFKSLNMEEVEGETTYSIAQDTIQYSEVDDINDYTNSITLKEVKLTDGIREPITVWEKDSENNIVEVLPADEEAQIDWGEVEPEDLAGAFDPAIEVEDLEDVNYQLNFREVREDLADEEGDVLSAQGIVGIQQAVGMHYKDNPMGIAGWLADSVAPGTAVYFVPTKDYFNDEEVDAGNQISIALDKITNKRICNVAALVPDDEDLMKSIVDTVINHVTTMSQDEESQFRFAWCGIKKPTDIDADGVIAKKDEEVEQLVSYTQSIYERKAALMFQGGTFDLLDADDYYLNPTFLAAMTAVFKSSIEPEQGMTRLNVGSPIKELDYFDRYKPSQESELSNGGVWLWKQRNPGENIHCRHQVTTNTKENRTLQQSVQATLDYISYAFIDTLDLSIGVNNVSEELIRTIKNTAKLLISSLKKDGKLRAGSEVLEVYEDPDNSSRVRVKAQLVIPTPLDQIVITLVF